MGYSPWDLKESNMTEHTHMVKVVYKSLDLQNIVVVDISTSGG